MTIIRSGQFTKAEAVIFNATIIHGLDAAVGKQTDLVADKIALVRPVVVKANAGDPLSKKIPVEVVFPVPAGTPLVVEDLTDKDRPFNNLIETAAHIAIKPYGAGYFITRRDFFNDVYYVLTQIPKKLVRAMMKLPDVQLAKLLRGGCEGMDCTGKPYFAADKFGKCGNLFRKTPLTRKNLIAGCIDMLSRRTAENGDCEAPPDTLIVPPTLFAVASKAVGLRKLADSNGVVTINRKKRDKSKPLTMIKQIIVMPELLQGGQVADQTTWYLASCLNPSGPAGLLVAVDSGFEYITNMAPSDPEVFYRNRFAFGGERYGGFAYGNALFMSRFEAESEIVKPTESVPVPEPSAPVETVQNKEESDARRMAEDIAQHLNVNVEDILKHTGSASQLPNASEHVLLKDRAIEMPTTTTPSPAAPETHSKKKRANKATIS